MVPIVERDDELFLILTRRASHLKHHPGQISFPGGKVDPEDIDAFSTAVREMEEEIGVTTSRDDMLGSLPALPTITGYHVTPILSFVDSSYIASINEQEVDCLFELPLGLILDKSSWNSQQIRFNGKSYNIDAIHFEGHLIWGVTAQILRAFIAQLGFK
ncbi:CoA pyrophosphatase [Veronia nyctiphanis]|uniref:CoA pyrophosphatase n=2 Tax=Veronia nyctiphanis TaxID=1278244 RepID=A0A4Q0YPI7_9GAMM|nr:CoA pyrophosphatase [Veronia nyctiphanis]